MPVPHAIESGDNFSFEVVQPAWVRLVPRHTFECDCSKHSRREGLFACRSHLRIDRWSTKVAWRRLVVAASNKRGGCDNDNQACNHGVGRQHFSGPFAVTAIDTWHARDLRRRFAATFGNQQQIVRSDPLGPAHELDRQLG